jgi:pyrroloquinoline quinone biosynthesis protein D
METPFMTNNWSPCIAPGMRLQFEAVQDTWVLLYPEGMVKLNPSASAILQRCNGKLTVAAIVADLEAAFNATGIAPEVTNLLNEGVRRGWIV